MGLHRELKTYTEQRVLVSSAVQTFLVLYATVNCARVETNTPRPFLFKSEHTDEQGHQTQGQIRPDTSFYLAQEGEQRKQFTYYLKMSEDISVRFLVLIQY